MGYTDDLLDDVRSQLAPDDAVLKEARERRDTVRRAAENFRGAQRSFPSGSLAHGTANCPIHLKDKGLDGDCGVVLNHSYYPALGPDSPTGEPPSEIVDALRKHIRPLVLADYPGASFRVTKRAILVRFAEPLPGGEDPTVDLVVGLERRNAAGLWIPNTEQQRWDPSHPEKHTELLTGPPKQLRVLRARAIRLAKAENKRSATPPLCSFNIEAFGWMFVNAGAAQSQALLAIWELGAADLNRRLTPDPAKVSAPIKVADRERAVKCLKYAATRMALALDHDDNKEWVREQLRPLWPDFIADTSAGTTKARAVSRMRAGQPLMVTESGMLGTDVGAALKRPRSFGDLASG